MNVLKLTYLTLFTRVLIFLLICCSLSVTAQDILDVPLNGDVQGKSLTTVLTEIEKQANARFYFLPEWVDRYLFNESHLNQTLGEALDGFFMGSDLYYVVMYSNVLVIVKDPAQALLRKDAIQTAIKQNKKVVKYSFGSPGLAPKSKVMISGKVVDAKTNEPLPRANIQINNTPTGTTTDDVGNFTLLISPGDLVLSISFIDFETKVIDLIAYDNGDLNIEMEKAAFLLDEVVINAEAEQELKSSRIGEVQLSMKELKRSPSFLGEVDLIKQIQNLPGVSTTPVCHPSRG